MDLSIAQVPAWISISFGLLMVSVPTYLIANTVKVSLANGSNITGNKSKGITFFLLLFFIIIAGISLTGFFTVNTLPPRVLLFAAFPLLLFYLVIVQRTHWFKQAFKHVRLEQLIQIHIFRFVGVFFYLLYAHGALPQSFAFIGGTGDILTAAFAIPVVYWIKKNASFAKPMAWAWNIFGLVDIVSVLVTALIVTRAAIANNEVGVGQFGTFPFSWIPTFAPATIIFLHLLIFRKLANTRSHNSVN